MRSMSDDVKMPEIIDAEQASAEALIDDDQSILDVFEREAIAGLKRDPKHLPSKYFYDARGSELFEQITALPEYYPTRTEVEMMERYGAEIADALGPECAVIEYGSGSGLKTRYLLDALDAPAGYIPVEISREALAASVVELTERFPDVDVRAVRADYTRPFDLPHIDGARRRAVYFPGSTIGNFTPEEAVGFMHLMREHVGAKGAVVIGVDLRKDPAILHDAYNDASGVTAAFNLNLANRLRDQLGATINIDALRHYALYNPVAGRIEMHLVNLVEQVIEIGDEAIPLAEGETILTEYSYKYTLSGFAELADDAGFTSVAQWVDDDRLFSIHYLEVR